MKASNSASIHSMYSDASKAARVGKNAAKVTKQVETAQHFDNYFYGGHVTVMVKNGVVYLQGIVVHDWGTRIPMRKSKKITGVRRMVYDLEISNTSGD